MNEMFAAAVQTPESVTCHLLHPCICSNEMARSMYDIINLLLNCWNFPLSSKDTLQQQRYMHHAPHLTTLDN